MPGWKISGLALAEGLAGFTLLWSGLTNTPLRDTLTGFLKGQPPAVGSNPGTPPTIGIGPGAATSPSSPASGSGSGSSGAAPAAPASVSGNVANGKLQAAAYGWTGAEWNALYALWERESGWSNTSDNASSGAYGIAQALGHGTGGAPYPASSGSANPPQYGGSSSATAQIAWGLSYIKSRYGDPEAAWAHEESQGWY